MPYVIGTGNAIVRVKLFYTVPLREIMFTFATTDLGSINIGVGSAFYNWLKSPGTGSFHDELSNQYEVKEYQIQSDTSDITIPVLTAGSLTSSDLEPPSVCALVKKETGLRGRHNRGRMYWPGVLAESHVDNAGGITSARVASLQTCADAMLTALAADDAQMSVLDGLGDAVPVTTLTAESIVASQRRRIRN